MVQRQAIFILGMSGSGTSVLARALSLSGAWLPQQLLGPNDGSPKGHWEPLEALRLNEEFLSAHGATYYDPSFRLQEEGSVDEASKSAFIDKIGAFLESLPHAPPAVIKEPRIVALADFWFEAARRSSIDVKVIIPVRHPAEVAASLAKRDRTSCELSNALWLKYNLLAERSSRTLPRVFVEYSSVLADWRKQISRISKALSVRFDNRDDEAIREFLTPDLYRQRGGELTEAFGSSWVGKVYGSLSAAARGTRLDTDTLDQIFTSYSASERTFRTALNEFRNRHAGYRGLEANDTLAARDVQLQVAAARLATQATELAHTRSYAEALGSQLLEANATLRAAHAELETQRRASEDREGALTRELARHGAQLAALQRHLFADRAQIEQSAANAARSRASIAQLFSLMSALRAQVETYERSYSWRMTAPLRAVRRGQRGGSPLSSFDADLSALRLRAAPHELPEGFDRVAYLRLNPDVAASGIDPADHYLSSGCHEGRAYSRDHPEGFDPTAYLALNPDVAADGLDPAHHYLSSGRQEGRAYSYALPDGFDPSVYRALNPDVAASGIDPGHHYLSAGRQEGRAYSRELPDRFDRVAYLMLNPDVAASGLDPADHYLSIGRYERRAYSYELPDGFDAALYLELNPDVAASGMDPAHHYSNSGRDEGRDYCYPAIELRGTDHVRADRESILVVSHDASRTGAPMITLSLVSELAGRYNVVVLLLGEGPLIDSFERAGAVTVVSPLRRYPILADAVVGQLQDRFRFRFALVNSIESRVVLKSLAVRFVPVVSLLHEFAAYTRPGDAFPEALLWSSEVVLPADITRQSLLEHRACSDARAVHTIPQGRFLAAGPQVIDEELEKEGERLRRWMRPAASGDGLVIVIGAGSVVLRKGVDLFIEVAARVVSAPGGGHCRFIWFGDGYDPDGDADYSAYLADQVQRSGLEEHLFFAGETRVIEAAYAEADLFLMSSRLDPLPNVAVDAFGHGKPVLCFDKATGIADFLKGSGLGDRCVARYLDTADMAGKIRTLAGSRSLREEVGEKGREASISYFNMTDYVTRLDALAAKAIYRGRREAQDAELILGAGLFRLDFGAPPLMNPPSLDVAVRLHVRSWASGVYRRKPFPGFHPGVYLEQHGVAVEGADPTADYIAAGRPDGEWNSTVISPGDGDMRELPANDSVALHLHVFYPDLLPDIMSRLSCNRSRPELLVSVASAEAREVVARCLESYEGKVAALEVVPNRGRDIGPFLTQFGRRILSEYAYVGHIHTKRTEAVKDATVGKTWLEFLMANLLGSSSGAMADAVLASMKADCSLGIVFPDDPNALGWGTNRRFAERLASKIGIKELPQHFNFPVGTMFWARTCALSPLIDMNLQWDDYPQEPVPHDGTSLHAIERLFPLTLPVGTLRTAVTNVVGVTR